MASKLGIEQKISSAQLAFLAAVSRAQRILSPDLHRRLPLLCICRAYVMANMKGHGTLTASSAATRSLSRLGNIFSWRLRWRKLINACYALGTSTQQPASPDPSAEE